MSVICNFSGYIFLEALENAQAETVSDALMRVFAFTGYPLSLRSDLGSQFMSNIMQTLWKRLGIEHVTTAPFSSSSNGFLERRHRDVSSILRTSLGTEELTVGWDKFLSTVELALRTSSSPAYPISPSMIVFGKQVRCGADLVLSGLGDEFGAPIQNEKQKEYLGQLEKRLKLIHAIHAKNVVGEQASMKKRYDSDKIGRASCRERV